MGDVEIRSMVLPLTSTLDGADSEPPLPSKMRTFWNNVALTASGRLPCAWTVDTSPSAKSAATKIRSDIEVMTDTFRAGLSVMLTKDICDSIGFRMVAQPRVFVTGELHLDDGWSKQDERCSLCQTVYPAVAIDSAQNALNK